VNLPPKCLFGWKFTEKIPTLAKKNEAPKDSVKFFQSMGEEKVYIGVWMARFICVSKAASRHFTVRQISKFLVSFHL
jgi:hypothetical protein